MAFSTSPFVWNKAEEKKADKDAAAEEDAKADGTEALETQIKEKDARIKELQVSHQLIHPASSCATVPRASTKCRR